MIRACVVLWLVVGLAIGCGNGDGTYAPGQDTAGEVSADAAGDVALPDDGQGQDRVGKDDLKGVDLTPDGGGSDAGQDVPVPDDVVEMAAPEVGVDAGEDIALELVPEQVEQDVVEPLCVEDDDCLVLSEDPGVCKTWGCVEEECVPVAVADHTPCDDEEPCTVQNECLEGLCVGVATVCNDDDICTADTCEPGYGCVNQPLPPQACVDGDGNLGKQECANGQWGECQAQPQCKIKLNANDTGTVNPFIFPAREGDFYVTFVASEDEGGNLKLLWVDPETCSISNGPFNVNDVLGGVYYWGAQWAHSDGAGNFYAVWEAKGNLGDVKFASSQTGTTFGASVEVVSTSENGIHPSLALGNPGQALVAWSGYNGAQYDPYFSTNPDVFGAGAFSAGLQADSNPVQVDQTALAVDDEGNIYLGWQTFPDGSQSGGNIYVAKSTDGGATFGDEVQVNDVAGKANVGNSQFIAWGGGKLYVVWSDERSDPEGDVYMDSSEDGVAFGADKQMNDSGLRYQEDPSVVVGMGTNCKDHVYSVWQDFRSNQDYEVWGTKSTDKGATFEPNIQVSPQAPEDQMNPALAVDPQCVVGAVWRDSETNGSFDVRGTFLPVW